MFANYIISESTTKLYQNEKDSDHGAKRQRLKTERASEVI